MRAYFECTQYVINSTLKTSKDRGFIEIMISDQVTLFCVLSLDEDVFICVEKHNVINMYCNVVTDT